MVPKTVEEIEADHVAHQAEIDDVRWSPSLGAGLGMGALAGVAFYAFTIYALPGLYAAVDILK
jgi:amino acid transporter, AAT family